MSGDNVNVYPPTAVCVGKFNVSVLPSGLHVKFVIDGFKSTAPGPTKLNTSDATLNDEGVIGSLKFSATELSGLIAMKFGALLATYESISSEAGTSNASRTAREA